MRPALRHRAAWLAAALAYWAAVTLAHLPVSLWLVQRRSGPWGEYRMADALPAVLLVCGLALCVWVVRGVLRAERPRVAALAWLAWGGCVFAADRWLTFSLPEYLHYPQYALLALLFARALDPDRSLRIPGRILLWTTLCGGADELAQYLWTTTSYSEYLDFNDVVVNLLAAVAGTLLHYQRPAAGERVRPRAPRPEAATLAAIALAAGLAIAGGRLAVTPPAGPPVPPGGIAMTESGGHRLYLQRIPAGRYASWRKGPYRGRYWILDPLSGLLLTFGGGGAFAWLIARQHTPGRRGP